MIQRFYYIYTVVQPLLQSHLRTSLFCLKETPLVVTPLSFPIPTPLDLGSLESTSCVYSTVAFYINRFLGWLFHIAEVTLARKPRIFHFFLPLSFTFLQHQEEWSSTSSVRACQPHPPIHSSPGPHPPRLLVGFLSNPNALTITLCSPRSCWRSAGVCTWRRGGYDITTCKTLFLSLEEKCLFLFCFLCFLGLLDYQVNIIFDCPHGSGLSWSWTLATGHWRLWPTEAWLTMAVKGRHHLQTVW